MFIENTVLLFKNRSFSIWRNIIYNLTFDFKLFWNSLPYLSFFRKVQIIVILNAWRDLGRHKNTNEEVTYAEMAHIIFQKRFKVEFLQMYKILGTLILVILYLFLFWFSIPRYSVLQEPAQLLCSHLAGTTQFYRRAVFIIVRNQNKPICT